MAKPRIREIIKYLNFLLKKRGIQPEKIILFGSAAEGKFGPDSDIDLLVISPAFRRKGIFKRAKMLGDLEWELIGKYPFPFDIITMSPQDYEKGSSLIARFAEKGKVFKELD